MPPLAKFLFCSILEQNGSKFLTESEPKPNSATARCGAKMFVAGVLNLNQQVLGFMARVYAGLWSGCSAHMLREW